LGLDAKTNDDGIAGSPLVLTDHVVTVPAWHFLVLALTLVSELLFPAAATGLGICPCITHLFPSPSTHTRGGHSIVQEGFSGDVVYTDDRKGT